MLQMLKLLKLKMVTAQSSPVIWVSIFRPNSIKYPKSGIHSMVSPSDRFDLSNHSPRISCEDRLDWSWNWFGGITDGVVTDFDLSWDSKLLLADTGALQIRDPDGAMWRLGGVEAGLPFANLTSVFIEQSGQKTGYDNISQMELSYIKSKYWIGAKDGLILYDDLEDNSEYENKWKVFQGYRHDLN